jgi:hypothetical protein
MSLSRRIKSLWLPIAMLAVAGFLVLSGAALLTHPTAGTPAWLGWLLLGGGALKAALWIVVGIMRVRFGTTQRS